MAIRHTWEWVGTMVVQLVQQRVGMVRATFPFPRVGAQGEGT